MKKLFGAAIIFGIMLISSASFAQEQKMTSISFEDDRIEGDLMAPNSTELKIKDMDELTSLIKAREDFVDEMRKTVDEL